jgi:hypothetical protein
MANNNIHSERLDWTEAEQWAWRRIVNGQVANFDSRAEAQNKPEFYPDVNMGQVDIKKYSYRCISPGFIVEILSETSLHQEVHRKGVRIQGAWITDTEQQAEGKNDDDPSFIDLEDIRLQHELELKRCRIDSPVVMTGQINLHGLRNSNEICLAKSYFNYLIFADARVEGTLDLTGIVCAKGLDLSGLELDHDLLLEGANIIEGHFNLKGAKIGGQVNLTSLHCSGIIDMGGIRIEKDLYFINNGQIKRINLNRAHVRGRIYINRLDVQYEFDMSSLRVHESLTIEELTCGNLYLNACHIGDELKLIAIKTSDGVDLTRIQVERDVTIARGWIHGGFTMEKSMLGRDISLLSTEFDHVISMGTMEVTRNLKIDQVGLVFILYLRSTYVGGDLNILQSKDREEAIKTSYLDMAGVNVQGNLTIIGISTLRLDLRNAQVYKDLSLREIRRSEYFGFDGIEVGGNLIIDSSSSLGDGLTLESGRIQKDLNVTFSGHCTGELNFQRIRVGRDVKVKKGTFQKAITMCHAEIGGNLFVGQKQEQDLGQGRVIIGEKIDLDSANISGRLEFSPALAFHLSEFSSESKESENAREPKLILKDVKTNSLYFPIDWFDNPSRNLAFEFNIDLSGLFCETIQISSNKSLRSPDWYLQLLGRDPHYRKSTYTKFAKIMLDLGHKDMADEIMYKAKEKERSEVWNQIKKHKVKATSRWIYLSLLDWSIGYGFGWRYFKALGWMVFFIAVNTAVIMTFSNPMPNQSVVHNIKKIDIIEVVEYSTLSFIPLSLGIDLPIGDKVRLNPQQNIIKESIERKNWLRWLQVAHQLLGYLLSFFIVAGLTGITKR